MHECKVVGKRGHLKARVGAHVVNVCKLAARRKIPAEKHTEPLCSGRGNPAMGSREHDPRRNQRATADNASVGSNDRRNGGITAVVRAIHDLSTHVPFERLGITRPPNKDSHKAHKGKAQSHHGI